MKPSLLEQIFILRNKSKQIDNEDRKISVLVRARQFTYCICSLVSHFLCKACGLSGNGPCDRDFNKGFPNRLFLQNAFQRPSLHTYKKKISFLIQKLLPKLEIQNFQWKIIKAFCLYQNSMAVRLPMPVYLYQGLTAGDPVFLMDSSLYLSRSICGLTADPEFQHRTIILT